MVGGAVLVAIVVAGFLAVAHYRAHRLLRDLPARLGADIQKETNGFTYSQSVKGRTVFTIHAAKATQHKDGRTGLEDVGIVLYGQKDGRADRIYGKQFEYDQKNGVVRAMGEVQLDLQAPAPVSASARAEYARGGRMQQGPARGDEEVQPIHVVTSGLVFVQSLGVASTDQPIRFEYRGMTGQARGAAYNADTGVTTLESEVRLSALREGQSTVLTAAHAEMDRASHQLTMRQARYLAMEKGDSDHGANESMAAGVMVVHLGGDGGVERAEGAGGVEVASGESRMQAPNGELRMNAEGRAVMARMMGGVRFSGERAGTAGERLEGEAASGLAQMDGRGAVQTVRLMGGVKARSQGVAAGETRAMSGGEMELRLAADGKSRRWVQQATLRGDARVQSAFAAVAGQRAGTEEMRGDLLVSRWQQERGEAVLRELTGEGQTEIRRTRDGVEEVSRGDRLQANFDATAATKAGLREGVTTATQQGNVQIDRVVTAKDGSVERTRAQAQRARYEAAAGQVRLWGAAEVVDAQSTLRAESVVMTEATGDAEATGTVQVTYRQAAPNTAADDRAGTIAEPTHAVAERAVLRRESGVATFFGTPTLRARLWQGGSRVEAPVLVFGREAGTLDAYGVHGGEPMPVRTVLVSKGGQERDSSAPSGVNGKTQVLRLQSGRLHYADATRRAEFSDGVVLEDVGGTMTSRDAVALLSPTDRKQTAPAKAKGANVESLGAFPGAGLERVTAVGDVIIRQPGRVATARQAVYTAADGVFVLTGGDGVLPKVTDEVNGSVTGAALRFRSGDNSVTVDGRANDGTASTGDGRVHTRTRVKQ